MGRDLKRIKAEARRNPKAKVETDGRSAWVDEAEKSAAVPLAFADDAGAGCW
jgi:hypothetical protein